MNIFIAASLSSFLLFTLLAIYWVYKACSCNQRLKANQELKAWRLKQQSAWKVTEPAKTTEDTPIILKGVKE